MTEAVQKTILIIDDEDIVRASFREFLTSEHFRVIEANDGHTGLDSYRTHHPDAILVDLKMPKMGGLDFIEAVRKEDSETPIVVISGCGSVDEAMEAIRLGAWDYILKPVEDFPILTHILDLTFEKQQLIRENRDYQLFLEAEVAKRTEELEKTNNELLAHKENLEAEVAERTKDLETTHKELVEKAHLAGMATISTDILHNIGNLLNSVIVSAQYIDNIVTNSSLPSLSKANSLLRDNMDNLAEFVQDKEKTKQLCQLYFKLEEALNTENQSIKEQLRCLYEKIDIIENVIVLQQNYAQPVFFSEYVNIEDVINDALVLLQETLYQRSININKQFKPTPLILVQRVKLIHILINLIQNAKEALVSSGKQQRNLTIVVDFDEDSVYTSIEDNGIGIPENQLKAIFNHGFTTKEDGHGFGLHGSANYMKEMGGELWCTSKGDGEGAIFNLKLPVAKEI